MKISMTVAALLGTLLLAGCHAGKVGTAEGSAGAGPSDTGNESANPSSGPTFSLRILGTDSGDYLRASLDIATVQVTGPGGVLASQIMTPAVDLAQTDQAWLLSSFQVPDGVEDVDFVVSFTGGRVETTRGTFDVDAGCSTLHLSGKVKSIAQRRHAVIQLDVARSMLPSAAGMTLIPQFQLVY